MVIGLLVMAILATLVVGAVVGDPRHRGDDDAPRQAGGPTRTGPSTRSRCVRRGGNARWVEGSSKGATAAGMRGGDAGRRRFWNGAPDTLRGAVPAPCRAACAAVTDRGPSGPLHRVGRRRRGQRVLYCRPRTVARAWTTHPPHRSRPTVLRGLGLGHRPRVGHAAQSRAGESEQAPVLVLEQQADTPGRVADVRRGGTGATSSSTTGPSTWRSPVSWSCGDTRDDPADAGAHGTAFDPHPGVPGRRRRRAVLGGYTADDPPPPGRPPVHRPGRFRPRAATWTLQDVLDLTVADPRTGPRPGRRSAVTAALTLPR